MNVLPGSFLIYIRIIILVYIFYSKFVSTSFSVVSHRSKATVSVSHSCNALCADMAFTPNFILFDQPLCLTAHTDWLILSGRVVSMDKSSCSDIMKGLQVWVEDKSTVVVEGSHFTTLSYCSVFLKEGELIFCDDNGTTLDPSTPATEPVHVQNRDSSSSAASGATTAIALILVIVVVVFIIILAVMWKQIHSKKVRYAPLDM